MHTSVTLVTDGEWGGSSFVELVTALNLGLLSIEQLRHWMDWSWRKLEAALAATILGIQNQLMADKDQMPPDKLQSRVAAVDQLQSFLRDRLQKLSVQLHRAIWGACATLAATAFAVGLWCLYVGCYGPLDILLLVPWPLYWLSSWVAYAILRIWAWRRARTHPAGPRAT